MIYTLTVSIPEQNMLVHQDGKLLRQLQVSTGKNGAGETFGSEKTPRGQHIIRAKIGANCPENTVFVGRRPTGEIYTEALGQRYPGRDWILTRILWLSGLEVGKNRLGSVDTMRRYVYIHGTPDTTDMTQPGSKGCIRLKNNDLCWLFDLIPVGTSIKINP